MAEGDAVGVQRGDAATGSGPLGAGSAQTGAVVSSRGFGATVAVSGLSTTCDANDGPAVGTSAGASSEGARAPMEEQQVSAAAPGMPRDTHASRQGAAVAGAVQAGGAHRGETGAAAAWIAWQIPSQVALAAAPPSAQRGMLKDALNRNLEANSLRLPVRKVGEMMALSQPEIMAALEFGPAGSGAAAAILRDSAVPAGRRRSAGSSQASAPRPL